MGESNHLSLDEKSKASWDRSYQIMRSEVLWSTEAVPFIETAVKVFRQNSAAVVVDVPCGDGRNTIPLATNLPFVLAADSSASALGLAAKRIARSGLRNCVLAEMDLFRTHILTNQVGGVFCWDVLGHLQRPEIAIRELLRICAPGGHLVGSLFSTGDSTRGKEMRRLGGEEYLYAETFFYKFYNKVEAENLLVNSGAELEHFELATWMEPPHEGFREYEHEHQSWAFVLKKL